jgi:hypothetical protein
MKSGLKPFVRSGTKLRAYLNSRFRQTPKKNPLGYSRTPCEMHTGGHPVIRVLITHDHTPGFRGARPEIGPTRFHLECITYN